MAKNGLLVDFFSPAKIAEQVVAVLARQVDYTELRQKARQTILDRYALHKLLPIQLNLLSTIAARR
jgi:hypothetical protein